MKCVDWVHFFSKLEMSLTFLSKKTFFVFGSTIHLVFVFGSTIHLVFRRVIEKIIVLFEIGEIRELLRCGKKYFASATLLSAINIFLL